MGFIWIFYLCMQLKMIVLVGEIPLEHSTIYQATDNGELRSWWVAGKKSSLIMWWVQATRQTSRPTSLLVLCSYHVLETTEGHFVNKYYLPFILSSSSFNVSPLFLSLFQMKEIAKFKFFNHFSSWIPGSLAYCFIFVKATVYESRLGKCFFSV